MAGKEKMSAFEKVKNHRKELVDKVIANMDKGYIWEAGWDINALRSQNPVSGAKYNGINKLSLGYVVSENNYQDPRFVTFKQAQDNNWKVKKGEHGHLCEYWIWTTKVEKENENGEKVKVEVPLDRPKVSYFTVFNMEQIEGNYPKFELPNKLSSDRLIEVANDLIASSRCPIKEVAQSRAYYSPSNDDITLPLRDSFSSSEDFLATLIHEMAHSTGGELGRQMSTGGKWSPEYAKEELVAELSSLFLKAELGIPNEGKHFENHSAYLNGWNSMLKSDPNELYRASKEADKACEFIMDRYREYLKTKENAKEEIPYVKEEIKSEKIENIQEPKIEVITKENQIEKDPMEKLSLTYHWSEYNFNMAEETHLKGKEAYEFLEKMMNIDKKESLKEVGAYKTKISFNFDDKIVINNYRAVIGCNEFGGKEKLSDGLEFFLKKDSLFILKEPDLFYKNSKAMFGKELSKEEIIKNANEDLLDTNLVIADFKKQEILKDINEKKINQVNEVGNKQGIWIEIKETSIIECKYNNGIKSGKFTETYLTPDENSPVKTQGMYRNDKLSGEIVSKFADENIASIKNYKAGVILIEENYYRNGNLKESLSYDKNEVTEFKKFYENGNLKESLEVSKDNEKIHNFYNKDGILENKKSNENDNNSWEKASNNEKDNNPWETKISNDKDNQWER